MSDPVTAVVLAGGSGTRFWPLSRRQRPKQLLALDGERSLLQATVDRLSPLLGPEDVWISTTADLVAPIRRQMPEIPAAHYVLEPVGRNTAPAMGWAVRSLPPERRRGVVVVLASDHRVAAPAAFRDTLDEAIAAVRQANRVLTLGVVPRWAETGYGYLELGESLGGRVRRVTRFREKPNAAEAAEFFASGRFLWNAGMFLFRGEQFLESLYRFEPEIGAGIERIAGDPSLLAEVYPTLPSIAVDFAVMERLEEIATLPLDCGWSDLGSWAALDEVREKDAEGNARSGEVVAVEARRNLLYADAGTIAVLGVEDLVVVRTADAVLVLPKARSQDVRRLLAELETRGRRDLL